MERKLKIISLCLLAIFSMLMVKITLPYFTLRDDIAFLKIKQWVIHNEVWKLAFFVHVFTSCFCLIAGFTQFSKKVMQKRPKLHRRIGMLYVIVIVLFSGPSGFIMGLYANGGLVSQIAFVTLSLLWIFFTAQAFLKAKARDFVSHEKMMVRSFALTLSALTLRAWKFLIVFTIRSHPMDTYMVVAWLGWIPNLVLAEWYIRKFLEDKKHLTETRNAAV